MIHDNESFIKTVFYNEYLSLVKILIVFVSGFVASKKLQGNKGNRRADQAQNRTKAQDVEGDVGLEFFQEKESDGDEGKPPPQWMHFKE